MKKIIGILGISLFLLGMGAVQGFAAWCNTSRSNPCRCPPPPTQREQMCQVLFDRGTTGGDNEAARLWLSDC